MNIFALVVPVDSIKTKPRQAAVSRATGVPLSSIQKFLKGTSEPTTATLQKLVDYFQETFIIEIKPRGEGMKLASFCSVAVVGSDVPFRNF